MMTVMTADDVIKLVGALAAGLALVLAAIGALYVKVRDYHTEVNGKMGALITLTDQSAHASGQLAGIGMGAMAERAEAMAYQAGKAAGIAQATALKRWMAGAKMDLPEIQEILSDTPPGPTQVKNPRPGGRT